MKERKWRTIAGLILLYIAVLMNLSWVWGILFLLWVIPDLFSGITYFLEPISKNEHPVLYWLIMLSWVWMAVYMLLIPFFPSLA
ncbi:MAG: hypothetical protein R8P61_17220 [Bacteroidia bacterium]|nr:hypothetical protein [Bacteroidia bacterium]